MRARLRSQVTLWVGFMKSDRKASTLPKSPIASSDLDPDVLQAALDQAYNAVIVTEAQLDSPGPRIVYANPAFARQTGYPVEELIGQTPRILQGPDTDPVMLKELRRRLTRPKLRTQATGHPPNTSYRTPTI